MRKWWVGCFLVVLLLGLLIQASTAAPPIKLIINGKEIQCDVPNKA
ncbi:MAG: hypothetical protein HPY58_10405 [Firmicutes bacterium]|nr:hypothetical protein [Bacillota bacterium]